MWLEIAAIGIEKNRHVGAKLKSTLALGSDGGIGVGLLGADPCSRTNA